MTPADPWLSSAAIDALATAAERGQVIAPFGAMQLARHVAATEQVAAQKLLDRLGSAGLSGAGLAIALRVASDARRAGELAQRPTLVWSDLDATGSRDTKVVCEELFRQARSSVLLSTYSLGHRSAPGEEKGNPILRPLAERMLEDHQLRVRLFINLARLEYLRDASDSEVETAFVGYFRRELWPWTRFPEVYYDPRSLAGLSEETACLHAKCVVVDDRWSFVTSANLTEAAQDRNIEAGVLLDDAIFARSLRKQFESLIDRGDVRRLSGLG